MEPLVVPRLKGGRFVALYLVPGSRPVTSSRCLTKRLKSTCCDIRGCLCTCIPVHD